MVSLHTCPDARRILRGFIGKITSSVAPPFAAVAPDAAERPGAAAVARVAERPGAAAVARVAELPDAAAVALQPDWLTAKLLGHSRCDLPQAAWRRPNWLAGHG